MNKIFLVGLANAGKSTIFNKLTGSDVHTGNWHGVTVNKAVATCNINNQKYLLTDLPGVYGLTPFSPEEAVTVREILNNQDSIFVNDGIAYVEMYETIQNEFPLLQVKLKEIVEAISYGKQ